MSREAFEKWTKDICLGDNLVFDTSAGYVGVKDMTWQAWQAAKAHERTQIVKPGEAGWQLREVYFDDVDGDLEITAYRVPQAAQAQASKPIAAVRGYYNGMCVVDTIGDAKVLPAGMALYASPQAQAGDGWQPIATAPTDNKRGLYFARFVNEELVELDFNGAWEYWEESWEMSHINGWAWTSANGIEEPTHWAYQDAAIPTTQAGDGEAVGEVYFDAHDCAQVFWFEHPQEGAYLYTRPQPAQVNQQLPAAKVWNQVEGRDGKLYAQGWNACLAAIAAAQEQGK